MKGRPYITGEESAAEPVPGRNYPTILIQSNGILNVGNDTWIYHGRWRNSAFKLRISPPGEDSKDYWGAIALARLPRDRWGALGLWASQNRGSVWTQPLTLPAHGRLLLNASGVSGLRLAVGDEGFHALSGFGEGRPDSSSPDDFDAEVAWGGRTLSEVAGKTVRFHIFFARSAAAEPRLFAAYLRDQP